ncbi:Glycerophosphoryl diester phosphodiesterase [Crocosphaera watsonii WH 0003]|uniref:Glycerophosphoryl diester phosphodiesterase n=1 Tax=Crocosphaera watsonii WH 0003 TaxID=423471 RepID=G5JE37_CROWT|nr:Glycerophosphoryl diester phosphodiesterase [Crocosphaera watsonii WH 0003]
MWDGVTQVKLENLKELPYQEAQAKELIAIGDRLSKIKLDEVEKPARYFLAGLGKIERYYLTELEEELLTLIETKTK